DGPLGPPQNPVQPNSGHTTTETDGVLHELRGYAVGPENPSENGDRTASGLDLLLGRRREGVRGDLDLDGDVARAEHLDRLVLANQTFGDEVLLGDRTGLREGLRDLVQVHDLELDLERVLEALELRQTHVDGHLATLERDRHVVTSLRALGTTASRLTLRALTATHTGLGLLRARRRGQVVELQRSFSHQSTSSTVTRCRTVWTMPRISGRSSFTTTSLMRLRP